MMLHGLAVRALPVTPRYVLPDEVMPGVPWPDGFKRSTDAWARVYCGTHCLIEPGVMLATKDVVYLHPETYIELRKQMQHLTMYEV